MKNLDTTVVFFGNGPVASASLQGLVDSFGVDCVEAVVTKVRPAHHKGQAPVEELANKLGLNLWFASAKNELQELIEDKKPLSPVGLVIDYGVIITAKTIGYFEKGIINSHFSLLPQWRGADPITYSILSGQTTTGVSLMLINEGLDTGPVIVTAPYKLNGHETVDELTSTLVELSSAALAHALPLYLDGELVAAEQSNEPITYSRKLLKQDGQLVWLKTASELEREVRAFSGWPNSRTTIAGIDCAIISAKVNNQASEPGQTTATVEKTLLIGCRFGSLEILELQPAGKNKMPIAAFLNGYGHILNN